MSNKLFYRLGLEDLVEDTSADEPETLEEMAGEATPESDILAADQQGEELEGDQADVDGIASDTETMEEVSKGLEAALKSGKPSADAIVFSNMAINAVNKKWFGGNNLTVSAESISSPEEAIVASMEGAVDKIKELGRALVEKLKKMWNTFSGWVKSLLDGSGKLKARAEALAKKAGELKGKPPALGELSVKEHSFVKELAVDNKIDPASLIKGVAALNELTQGIGSSAAISVALGEMGKRVIEGGENADQNGWSKFTEAFNNLLKPLGGGELVKDAKWAPEGAKVARGKNDLPGNKALFTVLPAAESAPTGIADSAKQYGKFKIVIKELAPIGDDLKGGLTAPGAIADMAKTLGEICGRVGEYKKAYGSREQLRGLVIKGLEDSAKAASGEDGDKAKAANDRAVYARAFATAWSSLVSADYAVMSYILKTVKGFLAYGDLCVKQASEAKPAQSEPPKAE